MGKQKQTTITSKLNLDGEEAEGDSKISDF